MWEWINNETKKIEDKLIDKGNAELMKPVGRWVKETGSDLWVWFVDVLPDIAGYGVFAAGAIIMLSPLITKSGMIKPLSYLAGGLILTVCILMTN